jgi:ketosteroid isomerase-like protein
MTPRWPLRSQRPSAEILEVVSAEADKELARRGVRAWNENDWQTMESLNAPDAMLTAPEAWPESGTFVGWPAVQRQYERLKEALREERSEIVTLEAPGDGRVLAQLRWTGKWESGLDLDMEMWGIYEFEEGHFVSTRFHMDEESARKDFGKA